MFGTATTLDRELLILGARWGCRGPKGGHGLAGHCIQNLREVNIVGTPGTLSVYHGGANIVIGSHLGRELACLQQLEGVLRPLVGVGLVHFKGLRRRRRLVGAVLVVCVSHGASPNARWAPTVINGAHRET